jgi:hypothetical protein
MYIKPPLLSRPGSHEEDDGNPVSKQSSTKSNVKAAASHHSSVRSNLSVSSIRSKLSSSPNVRDVEHSPLVRGLAIDESTELPLSPAERAPPGTELPMKASEDFRRKISARKPHGSTITSSLFQV